MYIAMNRFKVLKDCTQEFEQVWFGRESYLHELPGFIEFHLLKGPERDDCNFYASHTVWRSYDDFIAWTKSEAFRKAHARAGDNKAAYPRPSGVRGFPRDTGGERQRGGAACGSPVDRRSPMTHTTARSRQPLAFALAAVLQCSRRGHVQGVRATRC